MKKSRPPKIEESDKTVPQVLDNMVKRKVAALEKVEADLVNLQYKIRRDPRCVRSNAPDSNEPIAD